MFKICKGWRYANKYTTFFQSIKETSILMKLYKILFLISNLIVLIYFIC